jgi:hypothetical protein
MNEDPEYLKKLLGENMVIDNERTNFRIKRYGEKIPHLIIFIHNLISLLPYVIEELRNKSKMLQYWQMFSYLIRLGHETKKYLLNLNFIGVILDIFGQNLKEGKYYPNICTLPSFEFVDPIFEGFNYVMELYFKLF